jgi:hypothetical protein
VTVILQPIPSHTVADYAAVSLSGLFQLGAELNTYEVDLTTNAASFSLCDAIPNGQETISTSEHITSDHPERSRPHHPRHTHNEGGERPTKKANE